MPSRQSDSRSLPAACCVQRCSVNVNPLDAGPRELSQRALVHRYILELLSEYTTCRTLGLHSLATIPRPLLCARAPRLGPEAESFVPTYRGFNTTTTTTTTGKNCLSSGLRLDYDYDDRD